MAEAAKKKLKIMIQGYWGSNEPTKAGFPFDHGIILAEAGHEVQIFLIAEAVSLFRRATAETVVPVGWPPLSQVMDKAVASGIQLYACHSCSNASDSGKRAPFKKPCGCLGLNGADVGSLSALKRAA